MAKSSKVIGFTLSILTMFFVAACDEDDMVGPVVVDAFLNPSPTEEPGGGGDGGGY